jgi:class 3 adenylate cyclase
VIVLLVLAIAVVCFINASRWINKPFAGFLVNKRMVLGDVGQYNWTGTQAGLKYPDKILKADGRDIRTIKDLESVVREKKVGDSVVYAVGRDGKILEISIPTMVFSIRDFLLIFGTSFTAGLVYLFVAVVVFVLKPDTKVSWAYFLFGTFLGTFSIILFDVQSTHTWLTKIYILSAAMFPATVIHLSFLFPAEKGFVQNHPRLQYLPYLFSGILALAVTLTYPGALFVKLYQAVVVCWVIAALCLVLSALHAFTKKTTLIARQRAKVVLLGAAIAFPLPSISEAVTIHGGSLGELRVLDNFLIFPLILFPASIAYAIAKHNLFDVDVFIKRTVGYVLMTAIVGTMYLSLQLILRSWVLSPVLGSSAEEVYPLIFALLVVFLFNPVNRKVQEGVDRIFFRKKIDYKDTVISVSNALSSVLNLDEIVRKIIHTVRKEMFIDMSGIVVLEPQKPVSRAIIVFDGPAAGREDVRDLCIPNNDPLLSLVSRERKLITRYDIDEDPRYLPEKEPCKERFSKMGATMVIPLIHQDEVKAVLAVGQKKSGHFYSREDVELLTTLASHGAVAIENAKLAERMQKEEVVRTNLARYLSPQIVDRIVQNNVQLNLGGDRKVVTVLFSDIRNFTTITESRPPDQLITILNEYFTSMAETIFEQRGSLDKYIGDAIVAVFGSLISLENPARNAVAAAVAMMNRLPELNRRWEERFGFSMNIGIGVNTGEVFLGNIGSPERMEFTVIGDAVNVASRFSGLAKPGQILVTKETLAHLGPDFPVREHPPAEVKGKSGKLEVFEVIYGQSVV